MFVSIWPQNIHMKSSSHHLSGCLCLLLQCQKDVYKNSGTSFALFRYIWVLAKIFHHAHLGTAQHNVMCQSVCMLAYEGIISPRDITMESYSHFKSYKRKNEF